MKTPREILLQGHNSALENLNRIRAEAISAARRKPRMRSGQPTTSREHLWPERLLKALWLELVWPARKIWAGFGCVWLALVVFNLMIADSSEPRHAKSSVSPAVIFLTWNEQQKLLSELLSTPQSAVMKERTPAKSQPRSECEPDWGIG